MQITLQNFRKTLQDEINDYLEKNFGDKSVSDERVERFIFFKMNKQNIAFALNLKEGNCEKINEDLSSLSCSRKDSLNLTNLDKDDQKHLAALFHYLATAENGHNLWRDINLELSKMPGWWSFFAVLRPLALTLKTVLQSYKQDDLKLFDDEWIKNKFLALKKQITELLEKIKSINKRCEFLEKENEALKKQVNGGTIDSELACYIIQKRSEMLIDDKEQIMEELEQLKKDKNLLIEKIQSLEKDLSDANRANSELHSLHSMLVEENEKFHKQIEQLLQHIKNKCIHCAQCIESINNSTHLGPVASLQPQRGEESNASINAINEQYQKYRRTNNPHGMWNHSPRDDTRSFENSLKFGI